MRIFRASVDDVPRIMECAREFSSVIPDCGLNEGHYRSAWTGFLLQNNGVIFMLEEEDKIVGGIGGIKHNDLITGKLTAVELFWYVKPEYRGTLWAIRLVNRFETWAEENGCVSVSMIHMECSMPEKLKEFYSRSGYSLFETVYRKRVSACQ